jgi:membrane carboxypeptidase/penicillin-binding protein PbpC
VLSPQTGEVLAYVGSVDFFKDNWGAYDVVTALRQPGSSIKPVTYALALSQGYTPATLIEDAPVSFNIPGSQPYTPVNYDGRYHGWVTLRQALANSYNIPAVKLADALGPTNIVRLGRLIGLTTWDEASGDFGLAVTLGAKEVRLLDLANVYATLARKGVTRPPVTLLEVTDYLGNSLAIPDAPEEDVLDPGVAFLISNILSDNSARAPTFGLHSPLFIPGYQVAVKTGTTDDKRDNWTMGYTPSYVVGVWVGNNDNSPMNRYLASGLTGAAPIWHDVMRLLLEASPKETFDMPSNVFEYTDPKCGVHEFFLRDSVIPSTLCPKGDDDPKETD